LKKDLYKNIIKVACVYAGAILGAGFASGKEITQYFIYYGYKGFYGLILSGFLFGIIGWAIMDITYKNNIKTYNQFNQMILGKKFGTVMELVSVCFMFILFSTMLSAGGAIAKQTWGVSPELAIIMLTFVCAVTLMFDMKGIIIVNSIVSPILLIGGIALGLYAFIDKVIAVSTNSFSLKRDWIMSAFIYVSYNIITSISVLTSMSNIITDKKVAKYGGLIGGFTLGIMGICLALGLIVNYADIADFQLPMLQIASQYSHNIKLFYILMLILAIYTTAIINGYNAINWSVNKFNVNREIFTVVFVIAGFIAGQLQFSEFVETVYPVFGFIGIFEVIIVLINFLFNKNLYKL